MYISVNPHFQMLRKSVETRDWLNTIEPRNVRAVMKRVVEDITAIDSLVMLFGILCEQCFGRVGWRTHTRFVVIYCYDDSNFYYEV